MLLNIAFAFFLNRCSAVDVVLYLSSAPRTGIGRCQGLLRQGLINQPAKAPTVCLPWPKKAELERGARNQEKRNK
ncbi:hypothetical protein F5144DRAFT_552375 [Chaetomium tenue]|uniref:Uncharacterized protein n=1 Tax=Chaetomium tenue TaxID=1854479 RepID=A0ACB7PK35_9PEZI|nr:hypothetical protein F5144DRAFT_552375 [Chaetomium globosum]